MRQLALVAPEWHAVLLALIDEQAAPRLLLDFVTAVSRVCDQGWGSVTVTVQHRTVVALEGKTTQVYAKPTSESEGYLTKRVAKQPIVS